MASLGALLGEHGLQPSRGSAAHMAAAPRLRNSRLRAVAAVETLLELPVVSAERQEAALAGGAR